MGEMFQTACCQLDISITVCDVIHGFYEVWLLLVPLVTITNCSHIKVYGWTNAAVKLGKTNKMRRFHYWHHVPKPLGKCAISVSGWDPLIYGWDWWDKRKLVTVPQTTVTAVTPSEYVLVCNLSNCPLLVWDSDPVIVAVNIWGIFHRF